MSWRSKDQVARFEKTFLHFSEKAAKLKADGVNIIIALGHSGFERDKQIAAQCPEIDLVIGGHCECPLKGLKYM